MKRELFEQYNIPNEHRLAFISGYNAGRYDRDFAILDEAKKESYVNEIEQLCFYITQYDPGDVLRLIAETRIIFLRKKLQECF